MEKEYNWAEVLPGYHNDLPEAFQKLVQLLEQNQFELLTIPGNETAYRLVYLMNDAVESFLVFENAKITGTYDQEYDGEIEARLEERSDGYILIVYQSENVFTLSFRKLQLEVHLFNYGQIGHFWVKGYEYLRLLEYRIAILRDKYEYLGAAFCTPEEIELAALAAFPPLNYCCYPAVSKKYVVPAAELWEVSDEALQVMETLACEVNDKSLLKALGKYRVRPGKRNARKIAVMLHRNAHAEVIDLLTEKLCRAAAYYENRSFTEPEAGVYKRILRMAQERQKELFAQGKKASIVRQEPFVFARDSIEFQVYVMIWEKGLWNRRTKIERFSEECMDA